MEESSSSTIKLIIQKGPKEGETLEYKSHKLIKIGRLVRGNTFSIKESGISSNHIAIQFDNKSRKWTLTDLNSSNGTQLNGETIEPDVPYDLSDGDCVKIGELTSIMVRISVEPVLVVEPVVQSRRNPRRKGTGTGGVVDGDLGGNVVEEGVGNRNLRGRGKKDVETKNVVESSKKEDVVDVVEVKLTRGRKVQIPENLNVDVSETKNVVESMSSKRILRSSKKGEKETDVPVLSQIPEEVSVVDSVAMDVNVLVEPKSKRGRKKNMVVQIPEKVSVDVSETTDVNVVVVPKSTRGRKKVPVKIPEDRELEEREQVDVVVQVDGRRPQRGRKGVAVVPLANVQSSELEDNAGIDNKTVRDDEGEEATFDESLLDSLVNPLENVETVGLEENVESVGLEENVQDHVAEKVVVMQEASGGKEAVVEGSLLKESSEVVGLNKGKEVVEELEERQHGDDGLVKDTAPDNRRWQDLEKMTLGDFFDYLEYALPKQIYDESEKIISDMEEKAWKCHELRLQRNEKKVRVNSYRLNN